MAKTLWEQQEERQRGKYRTGKGQQEYTVEFDELEERLEKDGIEAYEIEDYDSIFHSHDITINGKQGNKLRSGDLEDTGEIPNTFCPDCGSQGYRTDHPEVATCSYVPGWYFYYREEKETKEEKRKTKLIRTTTGEVVEVEDN